MRDLLSIPVSALEANEVEYWLFVQLTAHDGTVYRFTERPAGFVDGPNTWHHNLIKVGSLQQSRQDALVASWVELGNLDHTFTNLSYTQDLRDSEIEVSVGWFTPGSASLLGRIPLYEGRVDDSLIEHTVKLTLKPHITPWTLVSSRIIGATCLHDYKDAFCAATSPEAFCGRTHDDCAARGNTARFGGFRQLPIPGEPFYWRFG
jgi:hypothetical protein